MFALCCANVAVCYRGNPCQPLATMNLLQVHGDGRFQGLSGVKKNGFVFCYYQSCRLAHCANSWNHLCLH